MHDCVMPGQAVTPWVGSGASSLRRHCRSVGKASTSSPICRDYKFTKRTESSYVHLPTTQRKHGHVRTYSSRASYDDANVAPRNRAACRFVTHDTAILPNNLEIKFVSKPDVQFLWDEIFRDDCYRRHGLKIDTNATVIDVGGNIGMFAMYASGIASDGHVFVLEPIPKTFQVLKMNLQKNILASVKCLDAETSAEALLQSSSSSSDSSNDSESPSVTAYNVGVSDGTINSATFTFYPRAAGWSSLSPDANETTDNVRRFMEASLGGPVGDGSRSDGSNSNYSNGDASDDAALTALHPLASIGKKLLAFATGRSAGENVVTKLLRSVAKFIFTAVTFLVTQYLLSGKKEHKCPLVTVSDVIRQNNLTHVDFLKIDVERAEFQTLKGVEKYHRKIIKQIAAEVHDDSEANGFGLTDFVDLLTDKDTGFDFEKNKVFAEQPPNLTGGTLWNVYARR